MSIIEQIYDSRVAEGYRLDSDRELDSKICDIIKRGDFEKDENVSNLFFEAGGWGQREGFQLGFRIAVVIMFECLALNENFTWKLIFEQVNDWAVMTVDSNCMDRL